MTWEWDKDNTQEYIEYLQSGEYEYPASALRALAKDYGLKRLSRDAARRAVQRFTGRNPMDLIVQPEVSDDECEFNDAKRDEKLQIIIDAAREQSGSGGVALEDLCEKTRLVPSRVRDLVRRAMESGYTLQITDGKLEDGGLRPHGGIKGITLAPVDGRIRFAVISDTHFGSKYHRHSELASFMERAYEWGARTTLHCGDMLDGHRVYRGHEFDLSLLGISAQVEAALDGLPELSGHTYYFIDGNHDVSFWRLTGQPAGEALVNEATDRTDLLYLGPDVAQLDVVSEDGGNPLRVELLHPDRAGARGQTYHLQNYIESMPGGTKPHVLFTGHEHSYVQIEQRNVHAVKVPCFQAQTPYMARKHMEPTIGGLLCEVGLTKRGSVREFMVTHVKYYGSE